MRIIVTRAHVKLTRTRVHGCARIGVTSAADRRRPADLLDFSSLCSNPIAVLAIRAGTVSIPAIQIWLGGQHGEESQEGSEEDRQEA
jgi:hypothetical protein